MNKAELVDAVAERVSLPKKTVDLVVGSLLDVVQDALANGDKVTLVGFGTFEVRNRSAREGRNPKSGDVIQIPATKVPAFSAGKLFKEKVSA